MKRCIALVLICMMMLYCFSGCSYGKEQDKEVITTTEGNSKLNTQFSEYGKNTIRKSNIIDAMVNSAKTKENIESTTGNNKNGETKNATGLTTATLPNIRNDVYEEGKVCVQNSEFTISEELLDEINNVIIGYGSQSSFYVVSMEDNMTFGYNPDMVFETASTIKAPFALYCFKEIAAGNGSLSEEKVYEERFYRDGSGILQYEPIGGIYTLEQLLFYTIDCSDNIAYYMIHDRFWNEGYNNMLKDLGCEQYYLPNGSRWGWASPKSAALIWREIYKFSKECYEGDIYFNMLLNAQYSYIKPGLPEYKSAHKSGWTEVLCHDTGIVFAEKPYIIAIMTDNSGYWSGSEQIRKLSICADKVMKEYVLWLEN
ncbi:serine hydrolase [Clostridium sp.]|uniref:serine hydrolase n=1 Tax=Clostridium sp. TaxID=1506 RepID=UPI003216E6EE